MWAQQLQLVSGHAGKVGGGRHREITARIAQQTASSRQHVQLQWELEAKPGEYQEQPGITHTWPLIVCDIEPGSMNLHTHTLAIFDLVMDQETLVHVPGQTLTNIC